MHTVTIPPDAQIAPLLRGYTIAVAARRRQTIVATVIVIGCFWLASIGAEVNPQQFWSKIGNFTSYFGRLLHLDNDAYVWTDPAEWFWGLAKWSRLLGETILIAYVGTITGAVLAFFGCFVSTRNMMRNAFPRMVMRRSLEICRTVPDIVFALIFVVAFGLGALPGVLAIAIHTTGALGKLFAEVVENIDMKPVEGIAATGGSWFAQVRFGAVPQVLSNFASYSLLRFEVNVRGAAVIGIVGAGGIGQEFIVAIRQFHYSDVSAILVMIIVCVMLIDGFSERVRHRLLSGGEH
jgi:phosphonate transport system permease protein